MGIKANYLRKRRSWRWVTHYELMILLLNAIEVHKHKDIGFDDAQRHLDDFLKIARKKKLLMPTSLIESCLCAMSYLKERGLMLTLNRDINLKEFTRPMLYKHETWNDYYHFFEHKDDGIAEDDET